MVRDALYKQEPIKGHNGTVEGYQQVLKEEAVEDKRLMIIEEEFASVLNVMNRVGNTLSPVIRQGWDGGTLSTLVRNNPLAATNPHISIVGHITKDELLARLDDTSKANGFANRFLWVWVERSKLLPDAPPIPDHILEPLIDQLRKTIEFARKTNALTRDECARALWHEVYADLSASQEGLLGAVLSRAEAQVLRLSVAYALLDLSVTIRRDHIQAALALWKYCEESARLIFGDRVGDPIADTILAGLRNVAPHGLSGTEISSLFSRHKLAADIQRALTRLQERKLVTLEAEQTSGRKRFLWKIVG